MAIWQAIGRFAAWPIFFGLPAGRLTQPHDTAETSLQLFCRRPAPKEAEAVGRRICEHLSNDHEEPHAFRERWDCGLSGEMAQPLRRLASGSGPRALQDEAAEESSLIHSTF